MVKTAEEKREYFRLAAQKYRTSMTPEQRAGAAATRRKYQAARTPEQRAADAEYARKLYAKRTPEQVERDAENGRKRCANRTREQKEMAAEAQRRRRAGFTPEQKEAAAAYSRQWGRAHPKRQMFSSKRAQAQLAGLEFSLIFDDIHFPERCPILGLLLDYSFGGKGGRNHADSPSFDRINPGLGYVPGNVAVISMKANTMKSDRTAEDLRAIASWMDNMNAK